MNVYKWINTIALIAMIATNILANVIPIGGNTTGEVSASYPNLFTPAPITFAIWGVIYLFMTLFVIFQWGIMGNKVSSAYVRDRIGFLFVANCILNISWIIAWHNKKIEISMVLMILLLINLMFITKLLDRIDDSFSMYLMVNAGFDIYFGWIIAATIANASVLLTKLDWQGFGLSDVSWTIIVLLVGAVIGAAIVILNNRYFSGLAIGWAYVGIIIRHISKAGFSGQYKAIVLVAIIGIIIIMGATLYRMSIPNPKHGIVSTYE